MEELLEYPCRCGGKLKKSECEVEFFGVSFGLKPCEVCTKCGSEYLDNIIMKEIEDDLKNRGIFGLERNVQVSKSGNSLVIRIPIEIVEFLGLQYETPVRIFPVDNKSLHIEILG